MAHQPVRAPPNGSLGSTLQIQGIAALAVPVLGFTAFKPVAVAVGLYFLCYNPVSVVLAALMMAHASRETPATDFSLQFSLNQFFALSMVSVAILFVGPIGYLGVLAVGGIAALMAGALAFGYRGAGEQSSG